jgi:hypothetical protein
MTAWFEKGAVRRGGASHLVLQGLLILFSGLQVSLLAEEPSVAAAAGLGLESVSTEHERLKNLKDLADPTMIRRRVWMENEWKNLEDGAFNNKLTFGFVWGWKINETQDLGLRLKAPLAFHEAGSSAGDSDAFGIGDIDLAAGTVFHLSERVRTGGGLELRIDSASDDSLGDNRWRWSPSWGVSWDISKNVRTQLSVQYNHSFSEEAGVARERTLEVSLPLTFVLPDDWSVTVEYKPKVDFEKHGRWENIVRGGVSKHLKNHPVAVSLFFEKPLTAKTDEYKVVLGITRFLK